jgi:hypothetical protein
MAIGTIPSTDRDSRFTAQLVGLLALLGGLGLLAAGLLGGALDAEPGATSRDLLAVGIGVAAFGALLAATAPLLYAPGASVARRMAQVAVPVVLLGMVTPAAAALADGRLGGRATGASGHGGGHGDDYPAVPAEDVEALQDAIAGGLTATTSPAGEAPTAGMAPAAGSAGAGVGGLEQQLGRALAGAPTTVAVPSAPATEPDVAAIAAAVADPGHGHGTATPEQPLDRATRAALGDQLVAARAVALRYPTVAVAEAAGYTKVTGYLPLIGAHWIKWDLMDGAFDVAQPEMLLFDGDTPDARIVGLSYYQFSPTEPEGFVGPNDHWHQHVGLCLNPRGVVVGGTQLTPEQCAARGGRKAEAGDGWMVHAWVVPGWESPQGVFAPEHPGLT